jgi:uncharacterized protein
MIDGSCHIPLSKPIKVMLSLGLRHLLVLTAITTAGVGFAFAAPTLRQGIAAMAREDYVAAAAILAPIAQKGNPEAQAYMAYLYATGHGVPQDYTQAAIFYRRSAEQGYPGAQYELGLLYDKGRAPGQYRGREVADPCGCGLERAGSR